MALIKNLLLKTQKKFKDIRGQVREMKRSKQHEDEHFFQYEGASEPSVKKPQTMRIHIPAAEIAKIFFIALLFIAGVFFIREIRGIVLVFFVSLLFAAALDPAVDFLERRRIPRALSVLLIYIAIFFALGLFVGNLVPLVATEIGDLALKVQDLITNIAKGDIKLPGFLEGLRPFITEAFEGVDISKIGDYKDVLLQFANRLTDVGKNVLNLMIVISNGLLNTILVLVLTFLMTLDERGIDNFILSLFPARYGHYITSKSRAVKEKIGHWLRGQMLLMIAVGLFTYVGFFIIGLFGENVQYATTLAMFAGITEIIPVVGPMIAWLLAVPIVANQSFTLVVWVTVVFIVVQQLENNVLVPFIMKKTVGLNPIFVIIAVLIGLEFLGVLGMVIAIPVATTVAIFVKDYAEKEK